MPLPAERDPRGPKAKDGLYIGLKAHLSTDITIETYTATLNPPTAPIYRYYYWPVG